MSKAVALIATLDTKAAEIDFVRMVLDGLGSDTVVIDPGILGTPGIRADVTREQVAAAAGYTLAEVQAAGSRAAAVERMQDGLRRVMRDLYDSGRIGGALCLGGAEGALMGAAAMRVLPLGVPKLIVSPVASGRREFGPFTGSSDVMVMHSVIDILGLNSLAKAVFRNAAVAMHAMCSTAGGLSWGDRRVVGLTMLGQTTPGAMVIQRRLEEVGIEVVVFHANGVGGPAMDAMAEAGQLAGVVDFTVSEVVNTLFDGLHSTTPDRMTAAVRGGLPLVVVPGAADFFNQGPIESLPERFRARKLYRHNPVATLVRVEADEMRQLAREIAKRLAPATGPTAVIVPERGFSLIGVEDGPIHDREADESFVDELRAALPPHIELTVVGEDINSPAFAHKVSDVFVGMLSRDRRPLPPEGTHGDPSGSEAE